MKPLITSKQFSELSKRDLQNGAVLDEIYMTLKNYESRPAVVKEAGKPAEALVPLDDKGFDAFRTILVRELESRIVEMSFAHTNSMRLQSIGMTIADILRAKFGTTPAKRLTADEMIKIYHKGCSEGRSTLEIFGQIAAAKWNARSPRVEASEEQLIKIICNSTAITTKEATKVAKAIKAHIHGGA